MTVLTATATATALNLQVEEMHFQPTDSELSALPTMSDDEKVYYFLTRVMESEEIWGGSEQPHWSLPPESGQNPIPLWPYQSLAASFLDPSSPLQPVATSLEHFIELIEQEGDRTIMLEIMPLPQTGGTRIEAKVLLSMFESLIDSGTYFIEG
ncbi:MAG: DUF2750 domain-containing protein [Gammaproteobacteria bacterium]|nr:DUF2750 domain-containing protein [Gammaproteobacteria bacterium]